MNKTILIYPPSFEISLIIRFWTWTKKNSHTQIFFEVGEIRNETKKTKNWKVKWYFPKLIKIIR